MSHKLFEEYIDKNVGKVKNRVVMSAMTRGFADENHQSTEDIKSYYERRAENGVGTIITEGIVIHSSADGYNNVPHIETDEQAESWRPVVEAVHKHDTKIIAQLWHCGRISHSDYTGGLDPVSSTDKVADGVNRQNNKPFGKPRRLGKEELPGIIKMFDWATEKALNVGFDLVEIHMGHGYLIDQFFDANVNDRTDEYGGSVENRCRFGLELASELVSKYGSDKVMIRISPSRFMGRIYEWPDLEEMLNYLVAKLVEIGITILDVSCANSNYFETSGKIIKMIRELGFQGTIFGGASLSRDDAENLVTSGDLDFVTWGRPILANYDFVLRLQAGEALQEMTDEMRARLF